MTNNFTQHLRQRKRKNQIPQTRPIAESFNAESQSQHTRSIAESFNAESQYLHTRPSAESFNAESQSQHKRSIAESQNRRTQESLPIDAEVFSSTRSFLPQHNGNKSLANAQVSERSNSNENNIGKSFYTQTVFDGGANLHLTGKGGDISKGSSFTIQTAGGETHSMGESEIVLNNKRYIAQSLPSLGNKNLISASKFLQENKAQALLTPKDGYIFDPKLNTKTHSLVVKNGVYVFEDDNHHRQFSAFNTQANTYHQLHAKFGHCHDYALSKIIGKGRLPPKDKDYFCTACAKGKLVAKRFKMRPNHEKGVLHIVHSDTVGPIRPATIDGEFFWTSFLDGYSRRALPLLHRRRAQTAKKWIAAAKREQRAVQRDINIFRHDNAKEFECEEIQDYASDEGITLSASERYNPRTNGKAERFNRTINSKARCLLIESSLPSEFWGYAVKHSVFLYNHTPRQQEATKDSPWRTPQGLYENKDDAEILARIENIPTFGELGYALIPKELRGGKFMDVSEEAVFLGLDENTNYPILYLLRNGDVQTVRTVKSFVPATKWTSLGFDQSPMFEEVEDEDYVPSSDEEFAPDFRNELEESKADMNNPENHEETEDLQVLNNNLNEDILPPDIQPAIENVVDHEENNEIGDSGNTNSRPTRQTALNSRLLIQMNNEDMKNIDAQLMSMLATEEEDFQKQIGELNTGELNTPNSWQEALRDPKWRQSMEEEIETLRRMKTWELVDLPPNRKAIKNKWASHQK